MAEENSNVTDLTLEVLKGIRQDLQDFRTEFTTELRAVRDEVAGVKSELREVRNQLHELADFTQAGFQALMGQGDRRFLDHEGRLRRLEDHAGFPR